ncbi:uncharacterized protein LOC130674447 isoform X2 [Microplitis mediator]|nr:uncharacterized protein LOC130674447 isoform X2 [Microplitis mediator]
MIVNDHELEYFNSTLSNCNNLKTSTNHIIVLMTYKKEKINESFIDNFSKLWDCNFLIVYAVCLDSKKGLTIYTFNPYTDRTTFMWEKIKLQSNYSKQKLDDRWTIHYRPYLKGNICQGFKFDRTKHLDGFRVLGGMSEFSFSSLEIDRMIEKAINVSIVNTRNVSRVIARIRDSIPGRTAVGPLRKYSFGTISQPLNYYSFKILTYNSGLLTPLEKIYNYYGNLTVISTVIILAITFIVVYLSEHNFSFAVFEILRLLINTGIKTRIDTVKSRIFFSMIFLYFLIIHGTFSGRLAGFLTKAEYRKNVETLEDLKDPRFQIIWASHKLESYFENTSILKKKITLQVFDCEYRMKNNLSVACIDRDYKILPIVDSEKLYLAKTSVLSGYEAFAMRNNWPLASRINDVTIWGLHSGLLYKRTQDRTAQEVRRIETLKARSFVPYCPVVFEDLMFSFILLGIGLASSITCFIIEILIKRKIIFRIRKKLKEMHIIRWISTALFKFKIKVLWRKFIHYLRRKK